MMESNTPTCWVKHQFFRLESPDRLIMVEMSLKGGEELSDSEHEALFDDAAAQFGGAGGWQDDAGRRKH